MKPWPKELAERYPLPPGVVPERPWWKTDRIEYLRSDLWRLTHRPQIATGGGIQLGAARFLTAPPNITMPLDFRVDLRQLTDDILVQVDKRFPLPHPGFRVGQVWAIPVYDKHAEPARRGFDIVAVASDTVWNDDTRFIRFSDEIAWSTGPTNLFSECDIPELLRVESYLLTDPRCPWLAPWAPAEAK